MIEPVTDVDPSTLDRFDGIIDVRSPAEFADDRIPRAVSLPVLTNEERAEVGTIYTKVSRFRARRIGAALVSRNVARHLETTLADKPAKWRPLIYCWRGGQRSNAMATILSQIGWRVGVLQGGYKTWRRKVVGALHGDGAALDLLLIDGSTGTAKSAILRRLTAMGAQTLDLEDAAEHRGSVFGAIGDGAQPSQKLLETRLWDRLSRLDAARTIIVEAESAQIGGCAVPPRLWRSMRAAHHVVVTAPLEARADYLMTAYDDLVANPAGVGAALDRLRPFHAKAKIEAWRRMAAGGDFRALAIDLMDAHYDPLYERSGMSRAGAPAARIALNGLSPADIDAAASLIAALVDAGERTMRASCT